MRTAVVLPAPLGPSRPSTRPCGTSNETPFSASRSPKRFTRPSATIAGSFTASHPTERSPASRTTFICVSTGFVIPPLPRPFPRPFPACAPAPACGASTPTSANTGWRDASAASAASSEHRGDVEVAAYEPFGRHRQVRAQHRSRLRGVKLANSVFGACVAASELDPSGHARVPHPLDIAERRHHPAPVAVHDRDDGRGAEPAARAPAHGEQLHERRAASTTQHPHEDRWRRAGDRETRCGATALDALTAAPPGSCTAHRRSVDPNSPTRS